MGGNLELVRNTYDAFARGDLDTVLAAFAEDIEWIEPDGYFAGAGGERGRAAVAAVFAEYPKFWSEFSVTPERYLEAGDEWVVVTGSQRGSRKRPAASTAVACATSGGSARARRCGSRSIPTQP